MESDSDELYEKEVFIRESGWLKRLFIKDIQWIKVEGVYTHVYSNSKLHTLRCTSRDIFNKLPKSLFFQVHKSYFVNIFKIDALKRYSLKIGNDVLPIGKTFYNKLLDKLPHLGG
ncbi:LytR/AlgR family response regulator transcription factor [Algoriphagus winogradskyi]|nr:LytTR family DNA-binding domain-containing protein [Algoriphagus winogradskyi]